MSFRLLPDQGSRRTNITSLVLRLLQLLLALIVLITYASLERQLGISPTQSGHGPTVSTSAITFRQHAAEYSLLDQATVYAAAALSILTAAAFLYIPTRWG